MGKINVPINVKLFVAVTFSDIMVYERVLTNLEESFGSVEILSAIFAFNHTQYYFEEMGANLKKRLLGFASLIAPDSLPDVKVQTNAIEDQYKIDNKRMVNIDPGYLSAANVVLATTKNFDHRIYLGQGIFGDVQLRYRGHKFFFNDWTYPDYRDPLVIEFLARLRRIYMKEYEKIMKERKQID